MAMRKTTDEGRPWPWECEKHWRLRRKSQCVRSKRHKQDVEAISWRMALGDLRCVRMGRASLR